MYIGGEGLYTPTFIYEKSDLCVVCSDEANTRVMNVDSSITLQEFIILLSKEPSLQLIKPSIISEINTLYMQKPPSLEQLLKIEGIGSETAPIFIQCLPKFFELLKEININGTLIIQKNMQYKTEKTLRNFIIEIKN